MIGGQSVSYLTPPGNCRRRVGHGCEIIVMIVQLLHPMQ